MKSILVFQTDFTYKEGAVCSMYGVVKSVDRELEIIDGTHLIPQFDTWSASFRLHQSMRFWPEGTIFVSVVDPGVGTPRKACVAKTADGYYIVSPDNGSLTHIKKTVGITEVREIDETVNRLRNKGTDGTSVFHGRDLFAYCAAKLACGIISYEQVGPVYPVDEIVEHLILNPFIEAEKVCGTIEIDDPNFGNVWTDIPLTLFDKVGFKFNEYLNVTIKNCGDVIFKQKLLFAKSFGFANKGDALIYNNELMNVALAICQGNFSKINNTGFGKDWTIEFEKR
ncbi:MAG: DNA-directed RNA polymerase subunit delta [Deltaproteobacteria bacterium]|nr:DNA-directed RNA polymerase subunit delta [Deltaproteobacteria bacterium]